MCKSICSLVVKKFFIWAWIFAFMGMNKIGFATDEAKTMQPEPDYKALENCTDITLIFEGLHKTDESWLSSYLGVYPPLDKGLIEDLEKKLKSSHMFFKVMVTPKQDPHETHICQIHIEVKEKWTTIPVIRGQYGGGTPLRIFGMYDSDFLGRLWTLGAETNQYGVAPIGYIGYLKMPRMAAGYVGFEAWQEYRDRWLYATGVDDSDPPYIYVKGQKYRGEFYKTLSNSRDSLFQIGIDIIHRVQSSHFESQGSTVVQPLFDEHALISESPAAHTTEGWIGLISDSLKVDELNIEGYKWWLKLMPSSFGTNTTGFETRYYQYWLLTPEINIAQHYFFGAKPTKFVSLMYFLGGLDSVRGLYDGELWGSHAFYHNLEFRYLAWKWSHLWLQEVVFWDIGAAGFKFDIPKRDSQSIGFGFRFAVPQVYRMVFRVDAAKRFERGWSISLGMNDFFQPYKPL